MKRELTLSWPASLSDISHNMNTTELWMLIESVEAGNGKVTKRDIQQFGYDEAWLDLGDDRYLVKYKTPVHKDENNRLVFPNAVFYIKKYHDVSPTTIRQIRKDSE